MPIKASNNNGPLIMINKLLVKLVVMELEKHGNIQLKVEEDG